MFWHVVMGHPWEDSFTSALIVVVTAVLGQAIAAFFLRRAGRAD
ncbi:hypothetical protein ACGFYA_31610 [Streptomyces sp. NPDC048305]